MKLALNQESIDALRDFSNYIPSIIDSISFETDKLFNLLYSNSDTLGVHFDSFEEMLKNVKVFCRNSQESVLEISYMLKNASDKIESYVYYGTSGAAQILNKKDIQQRYEQAIESRLNSNNTNECVKALYNEYYSCIRIADYEFLNTPHYNHTTGSIFLNAMADMHNPTGNFSTYFHEVGHLIDHHAGNGHTWLSSDDVFKECLQRDAEKYIQQVMINCNCERDEAYEIISEEISGNPMSSISDIFGSITNSQCQGTWGHSRKYWASDPTRVEKEAFANMFESSIGSNYKTDLMKKYFPTSYERFLYLVKDAL